jgi:hypothetical protein
MKPKHVTSHSLRAFLVSKPISVIRVIPIPGSTFNTYLDSQLKQAYQGQVTTGCLYVENSDYKTEIIQRFLNSWIPQLGLPKTESILPGYYLFKHATLIAYHPGTIEILQADPQIQVMKAIGSIAGILVALFEKDLLKGMQTYVDAMELPAGRKVLEFFQQFLDAKGFNNHNQTHEQQSSQQQKQREVLDEGLLKAYQLLKVSPRASDDEVKKAWRKALKESHSDVSKLDSDSSHHLTIEIMNAYELIKKSRAKAKEKAT